MAKQKGKKGGAQKNKGNKSQSQPSFSFSSANNNSNQNKKNKSRQQNKHQQQQSEDDDTKFRNTLLNQGNTINEMNSDGNCLFRSLSDQLYHDTGSKHDIVRQDVCNFLSENKEEFQFFLLMGDDDEDVLGIDEYIVKMREDGEWGGNVEIVVASRVYKRNIMVFSGEYSNGVLSIICNDKDGEDDNDLLMAYHGNDHYNSVHPIGGLNNKQSTKSLGNGSSLAKNKKEKKKGIDDNNENEQNKVKSQTIADGSKIRSRPPTRGSNCPCGSGLKYKKCCMAQEKSKKKLAKHLEKHGVDVSADDTDEKKEDEFIGEFKVLTI